MKYIDVKFVKRNETFGLNNESAKKYFDEYMERQKEKRIEKLNKEGD